jgi:hypothetical protein
MSIKEEVYEVLHENLVAVRPDLRDKDCVLCPICLREISRYDVIMGGVEHIIPRTVVRNDNQSAARVGTKNQRSGITLLCRQSRLCASDGRESKDGCNGLKGKLYDRLFRNLFDDKPHSAAELIHGHGVSILVMAYLGAFQSFGYEYILRDELDEIREQFDFPNQRKTKWLDDSEFFLGNNQIQITATATGQPFVFGPIGNVQAPLQVLFRRCRALLPPCTWASNGSVRHLEELAPVLDPAT